MGALQGITGDYRGLQGFDLQVRGREDPKRDMVLANEGK